MTIRYKRVDRLVYPCWCLQLVSYTTFASCSEAQWLYDALAVIASFSIRWVPTFGLKVAGHLVQHTYSSNTSFSTRQPGT